MPTSTRFIGWCPICENDVKVRGGVLVHHGYRRPGVGYIIGDCYGVHKLPYETSSKTAESFLEMVVLPEIRGTSAHLRQLMQGPERLPFERYDAEKRRVERDPRTREPVIDRLTRAEVEERAAALPRWDRHYYDWDRVLQVTIANTENRLKWWTSEGHRMEDLVANWVKKPLRTVEEEIQQQQQQKAEREAAKTATRNTKLSNEIAKIQKRIDSAVRNKNASVLADIYKSEKLRDMSGYRISRADALEMLDRDDVWRAFGLLTAEGYLIGEAQELLSEMTYGKHVPTSNPNLRYDIAPFPWPAALGGGIAKTRGL